MVDFEYSLEGTSRISYVLLDQEKMTKEYKESPCVIHVVMLEAENEMKRHLQSKNLKWLYEEVYHKKLPKEEKEKMLLWFHENKGIKE